MGGREKLHLLCSHVSLQFVVCLFLQIELGSTSVRVGTALFGPREKEN